MFNFIIVFTTAMHPNQGAVVTLCIKNEFMTIFFYSKVIYGVTLASALDFLFAL